MSAWDVIDEIRLASDTQYVEFTSIPATYRDLVIVGSSRNTSNASFNGTYLMMRINGASGSVYPGGAFYTNGATQGTGSQRGDTSAYASLLCNDGSDTGAHSPVMVHIPNYADSSNGLTWSSWTGRQPYRLSNTYSVSMQVWGWWSGTTAAVTSIRFHSEATAYDIKAGSFFTLYGINEL